MLDYLNLMTELIVKIYKFITNLKYCLWFNFIS